MTARSPNCINDPLALNFALSDWRDVVLLPDVLSGAIEAMASLLSDPAALYQLAHANWRRFRALFDTERQLAERLRVVVDELPAGT